MKYTVGIGILIEDSNIFNQCRDIELRISEATNTTFGLRQPPHITIKRPFEISDYTKLQDILESVGGWARRQTSFSIEWKGFGNFGDAARFIAVQPSERLKALHLDLLEHLAQTHGIEADILEGGQAVFHTSVAVSLDKKMSAIADTVLEKEPTPNFKQTARSVGVFMNVPDQGWVIIRTIALTAKEI